MVGDTLYLSTPFSRAVALDARSGRELWRFDPHVTRAGPVGNDHAGFVHRGVALWSGPHGRRVLLNARWTLHSLDAATGRPDAAFGDGGKVDLATDLRWPVNRLHVGNTSPPVVWGDVVIVGSAIGDGIIHERDPPGDVQAFDLRTGRRLWRWDPVPPAGDSARATWGDGSAETTGHANVWAPFSLDSVRGLVYLPVSTPSNDWYGGHRPGDNRWADAVVCLDARTGRLVWAQQIVRHGLWDYDPAAAPILATVRDAGAARDVVILAGKTGYVYVFDRVTGAPRWPMRELAAPASDVPGERTAATQRVPIWPEPFARRGIDTADVIALTPAIAADARALLAGRRFGPIFTPPSREGTIVLPGWIGGAGWGGAAVDPERQLLVVKGTNLPALGRVVPGTGGIRYRLDPGPGTPSDRLTLFLPPWRTWYGARRAGARLPVIAPPWGTLTAYDLVSGAKRWEVPLGDLPAVRRHPALRGVALPPLGVPGPPGGVVTRGGLIFVTGGGETLYAIDVADGAVRWSAPLGRIGYSNPMTYVAGDGRQYVVVATGEGRGAALQAFALPRDHAPGAPR